MDDQNTPDIDSIVPASQPENPSPSTYDPPAYVRTAHESKPSWAITSTQRTVYGIISGTVILALILACVIGVAAASGNTSTSPSTSSETGNNSVTATDTPNPTTTPNPNEGLAAYIAVTQPDSQTVSGDLDSVSKDCGASDINSCYSDLQTLSDDVQHFLADIDAHPAPPCLANADKNLRTGLQLMDKGARTAMSGIKQNDPTQVDSASSYFKQGSRYISNATDAIKVAQC